MSFSQPGTPNVTDYLTFLRQGVGIGPLYLPDNSFWVQTTFNMAMALVPLELQIADITGSIYTLAVYNLAADRLLNYAIDQQGQCYFRDIRTELKLNSFTPGVISASADQGTSQSWAIAEWAKNMTITDLQMLRTPYGRAYLDFVEAIGPNLWGLT